MSIDVRVTIAVARLLRVFLDNLDQPRYGYDLMRETNFASGKLYPILARLLAAEWLEKKRERVDPYTVGRPPRYWYRLTEKGAIGARQALAELYRQLAPASPVEAQLPQEGWA